VVEELEKKMQIPNPSNTKNAPLKPPNNPAVTKRPRMAILET